jgi:hypothetical protein
VESLKKTGRKRPVESNATNSSGIDEKAPKAKKAPKKLTLSEAII